MFNLLWPECLEFLFASVVTIKFNKINEIVRFSPWLILFSFTVSYVLIQTFTPRKPRNDFLVIA